ncbi:MAG TPA: hypothetical protein VKV15_01825 [Bryobacteraceae bacterium]|nr:hypothetical protein [Bryobacteraceae bacterium]
MRLLSLTFVLALAPLFAFAGQAQESPPPKQDNTQPPANMETYLFFSGSVAEFSPEKITVSRVILGKPAEKRTFLITQDTKVEGKLKNKARVTVRFVPKDEGDVATAILVRSTQKNK